MALKKDKTTKLFHLLFFVVGSWIRNGRKSASATLVYFTQLLFLHHDLLQIRDQRFFFMNPYLGIINAETEKIQHTNQL
jgi:hypothetical protein